ncbi:MAG: cysteine--tRNA ligase [Candidatus Woesearchaeota archaeon]|jgi:cysteinyl-tRNA synthetase
MPLNFYNDLSRKKELFVPLKAPEVTIYVCGPTIYDYAHLGHGRSAVAFDLLHRYLKYKGFKVKFVFNYTDIEDKMIKRANDEGITVKQLADKFSAIYDEDYKRLNLLPPFRNPKATEHIPEMIGIIRKLEKKGYTYVIEDDGVYYDVMKFPSYGKLSHQNLEDLKSGARVDTEGKKSPYDFVLWKFEKPGEPSWDSPWGKGRPGWHIECSAMSAKYLGETMDIHGGGQDLIFPHHEDEIAQSEAANDKPFARFWMHNGFITINGEKMSKSLNNFYTIRDVLKDYDPLAMRYFFISTHYRGPINFTFEALSGAKNALERVQQAYFELLDLESAGKFGQEEMVTESFLKRMEEALDDDLNISPALAPLFEVINEFYRKKENLSKDSVEDLKLFFSKVDSILGILKYERASIPAEIKALAEERELARRNKDWKKSDELREKITSLGYAVSDGKEGYKVSKIE